MPPPILEETVAIMKLATHEHIQTGPDGPADAEDSWFAQPQFINKVGDDRVTTQRQIPQSKWR